MKWLVYIVRCKDKTLYTGITNDLKSRVREHNASHGGAKYTRSRRPVRLVYHEVCASRSEALTREYEIKQYTREQKLKLIHVVNNK